MNGSTAPNAADVASDLEARRALLARAPLFGELGDDDLAPIARMARWCALRAGSTLFLAGDPVDALYVVASGLTKVFKDDPEGRKQLVLHLVAPGALIAEVAVFLESAAYPASCEAVEDTLVLVLPARAFYDLVDARPKLARALIRYLARRQGELVHLVDKLFFREFGARFAEELLRRLHADGQGFTLPTNVALASMLGTVPEIVSRKLSYLHRQGFIRLNGRTVFIPEPRVLADLAAGETPRKAAV